MTALVAADIHEDVFQFDVSMHDSVAVAVVDGLSNLPEDVELGLLGEAVEVLVEVVHETHLQALRHDTNVLIAHVEIL